MKIGIHLFGTRLWNIGEMLVFCLAGALEACIQAGLIPANTDYEKVFPLADLSAAIVDRQGKLQYASGRQPYPFPKSEGVQVMRQPISGGQIEWCVDLSPLRRLNDQLAETAQMLEARNAYLAEEVRIKTEKTELETRNAIYDRITRVVRPQLDRINALLDQEDSSFDEKIRPITVMSTYIKRRSNMELVAEEGTLALDELAMAVMETTDSLRRCGINAISVGSVQGRFPTSVVIAAYAQIESVIEDCMDTLSHLMISLKSEGGTLSVRMLLTAETLTVPPQLPGNPAQGFSQTLSVTKDGRDVILLLTYSTGGGCA